MFVINEKAFKWVVNSKGRFPVYLRTAICDCKWKTACLLALFQFPVVNELLAPSLLRQKYLNKIRNLL